MGRRQPEMARDDIYSNSRASSTSNSRSGKNVTFDEREHSTTATYTNKTFMFSDRVIYLCSVSKMLGVKNLRFRDGFVVSFCEKSSRELCNTCDTAVRFVDLAETCVRFFPPNPLPF